MARPGFGLVNLELPHKPLGRRDLSLFGRRVLAEVGELQIALDGSNGYVVVQDETAMDRIEELDVARGLVVFADGGSLRLEGPEKQSLLSSFVGAAEGRFGQRPISAVTVFEPLFERLELALSLVVEAGRGSVLLYSDPGLQPTYPYQGPPASS